MKFQRIAAVYLALQASGVAAWWAMLSVAPQTRRYFLAADAPDSVLLAFALPDLLFFVVLGLVAARALWTSSPRAALWLCLHAGGAVYAALWCWEAWRLGGSWLSALAMLPCAVVPPLLAWRLREE